MDNLDENRVKKSEDGIIGFSIGDALGVPAEFKSREELKRYPITDMIGDGTYNVPAGTWSDDTSMTLATIDSIICTKTINCNDMAIKFLNWLRNAEYTATNETFDVGRTTLQALRKYEMKLEDASNCGENNEYSNGNGSLMRMLPIAYYIYYRDIQDCKEIYDIVKQVSSITHAHEISILGCYIYVNFVLELLNGNEKFEAYKKIQKLNYKMFSNDTIERYNRILKYDISNVNVDDISTSGYVVNTLEATMWLFLNSNDYNTTILKAVNLGEDTDTVAACTGGILGLYYGIENIKDTWKQTLKKYDYIISLCNEFDEILKLKNKAISQMNDMTYSSTINTEDILNNCVYNRVIGEIKKLIGDISNVENIKIYTISEIKNNYDKIPNNNGVYFIVNLVESTPIQFTDDIGNIKTEYQGKSLLYNESDLIRKYNNGDKTILYIGKAEREDGLRKRLQEYIDYGYGKNASHRGGRAIWQIKNNKQLGLCWIEVDNSEKIEKQLLTKYKQKYKTFPVANWRI